MVSRNVSGTERDLGSTIAATANPIDPPDSRERFALASSTTATVLGGVLLALLAAGIPLAMASHQSSLSNSSSVLLVLAFAAVGVVVARHQPRQPMGWLLLGTAGFLMLSNDVSAYSVVDYRLHGGRLPLGWIAVLAQPTWAPAIVLLGLSVLLFPDGRLPPPRWRWPLWAYLAVSAAWFLGAFAVAAGAIIGHNVHVDSGGNLLVIDHPTGSARAWGVVQDVFFPVLGVSWILTLSRQIVAYRRATGERRLQLKWLLSGGSVCVVSGILTVGLSYSSSQVVRAVGGAAVVGLVAFPISIGVGILKYRLYEIDRLISRTLSYAIVTAVLILVFAGIVVTATDLLPFSSPIGVAASTLTVAASFNPLRRRVQRVVDRRFNRARYDADAIVAAFTARLRDAVDLESVRGDLVHAVERAVEPAHASVWINSRG